MTAFFEKSDKNTRTIEKRSTSTDVDLLAESVRFELTVGFPITSFQDWLLKPLGQLSMCTKLYHYPNKKSRGSDFKRI